MADIAASELLSTDIAAGRAYLALQITGHAIDDFDPAISEYVTAKSTA